MIIKKIHIDHFGKFSNYDLELEQGFTVLQGQNEEGKSTLMAFLQMMFYGHNGRAQDLLKNPRKKYRPWNGSEMKGYVEFAHQGVAYRLERKFGQSNSTDEVSIWNMDTGERMKTAAKKDPGQEFFGLGAEAFEKSVFLGQSGTLIDASGKQDEITQRLLNLVTTGSEDTSFKRVSDHLRENMELLVSRNRKNGLLIRTRDEIQNLKQEKLEAEQDEWEKELQATEIARNVARMEAKEAERRRLEREEGLLKKQQELEKWSNALERRRGLEGERQALLAMEEAQSRNGQRVDEDFLQKGKDLLERWDRLKERVAESVRDRVMEEGELEKLQAHPAKPVTESALKAARVHQEDHRQLVERRHTLEREEEALAQYLEKEGKARLLGQELEDARCREEKATAAVATMEQTLEGQGKALLEQERIQVEWREKVETLRNESVEAAASLEGAKSAKELLEEQTATLLLSARNQLEEAGRPQEFEVPVPGGRILRKPVLLLAVLLAAASIFLGVADPMYFLGLLVAGALLAGSMGRAPDRMERRTVKNETLVQERAQQLKQLEGETQEKTRKAAEEVAHWEKVLQEKKTLWQEARMEQETFEKELHRQREVRSDLQQERAQRKAVAEAARREKEDLRKRWDSATLELQNLKLQGTPRELEQKRTGRRETDAALEAKAAELAILLQEFDCADVEELADLYSEYRRAQTRLEDQAEDLRRLEKRMEELLLEEKAVEAEFLQHMGSIRDTTSVEEGRTLLGELKKDREAMDRRRVALEAKESQISDEEREMTSAELFQRKATLVQEILSLWPDGVPQDLDGMTQQERRMQMDILQREIQALDKRIVAQESEVREKYRARRNVSQIENALEELALKEQLLDADHEALKMAQEALEASFEEIQQSFGPLLNDRTAAIFHRLTDGRYRKVRVSRNFDITFEDMEDNSLHEWGFLSSGTIDQAYLALRMAVADLITQEGEPLPLLLDDVFTQYDDTRGYEGLKFLKDYQEEREEPLQILLFTCHRRVVDWAKELEGIRVQGIKEMKRSVPKSEAREKIAHEPWSLEGPRSR